MRTRGRAPLNFRKPFEHRLFGECGSGVGAAPPSTSPAARPFQSMRTIATQALPLACATRSLLLDLTCPTAGLRGEDRAGRGGRSGGPGAAADAGFPAPLLFGPEGRGHRGVPRRRAGRGECAGAPAGTRGRNFGRGRRLRGDGGVAAGLLRAVCAGGALCPVPGPAARRAGAHPLGGPQRLPRGTRASAEGGCSAAAAVGGARDGAGGAIRAGSGVGVWAGADGRAGADQGGAGGMLRGRVRPGGPGRGDGLHSRMLAGPGGQVRRPSSARAFPTLRRRVFSRANSPLTLARVAVAGPTPGSRRCSVPSLSSATSTSKCSTR